MLRNTLVFVCCLFVFAWAGAQERKASMTFPITDHNFGTIKEVDGMVTVNFTYINKGTAPLIITNVVTSCGCTAPNWTREPVLPGMKGYVSATYNPANRPGDFEKTITVSSNSADGDMLLHINGNVIPREKTIEELYPVNLNDLRLKTSIVSFQTMVEGHQKTEKLEIANNGIAPLTVGFDHVPAYLQVKAVPQVLQPKEKGVVEITFDAGLRNDWDFVSDRITLLANGQTDAYSKVMITANIVEDFEKLTPDERLNAPAIVFDKTEYNFGKLKKGKKTTFSFKYTNTGKRDLIIRKVSSSCGCAVAAPEKPILKPGESSLLTVTFDSTGKDDEQTKTVNIISNDPANPKQVLLVRGFIMQ